MKVGYFQSNPSFGEVEKNLDLAAETLSSIQCDLMVLPEFAMTGYQFVSQEEVRRLAETVPEGPTTRRFIELARAQSTHYVVGLPERQGDRCFNSAVLVGPTGFLGRYRKTHLFFEETLFFTPGDTGFQVWDIGLAKVGILICFDWFYPEASRTLALKGAQLLCHPANLVLPHCPNAMVTRCLENRIFCITADRVGTESRGGKKPLTYIGQSEVISPDGKILHRASDTKEELKVLDIDVHEALNKSLNPFNDLFQDRQPHWYTC